jgi:hypothetical protein
MRAKDFSWEAECDCGEEDVTNEFCRLEESYPSASIDSYQDEDHFPYLYYIFIKFKNEADEAEFIMRELIRD